MKEKAGAEYVGWNIADPDRWWPTLLSRRKESSALSLRLVLGVPTSDIARLPASCRNDVEIAHLRGRRQSLD